MYGFEIVHPWVGADTAHRLFVSLAGVRYGRQLVLFFTFLFFFFFLSPIFWHFTLPVFFFSGLLNLSQINYNLFNISINIYLFIYFHSVRPTIIWVDLFTNHTWLLHLIWAIRHTLYIDLLDSIWALGEQRSILVHGWMSV